MTETKPSEAQDSSKPPENKEEANTVDSAVGNKPETAKKKGGSKHPLTIFYHWCKACNICIAYCPQKVFIPDRDGKPIIANPEECTQCAFCWMHCPDLAIVSNEK